MYVYLKVVLLYNRMSSLDIDSFSFDSATAVESFITKLDVETLNSEQKTIVSQRLQSFLDRENNGANSKLRRKVSRFIETISGNLMSLEEGSSTNKINLFIQSLSKAKHISEVEQALNSFELQSEFDVLENVREKLKGQLNKTMNNRQLTNKRLRHRMEKLIFVISSKSDQLEIKNRPKIIQVPKTLKRTTNGNDMPMNSNKSTSFTSSNRINKTSTSSQHTPQAPMSLLQKRIQENNINDILKKLNVINTSDDFDKILTTMSEPTFQPPAVDSTINTEIIACLQKLSDNANLVNAKIRRKVKRVSERLTNQNTADTEPVDEQPRKIIKTV